jgi:hypothetical protein
MGTTIRPEISERNKYYIDRHRYYELKHFCLQYPGWRNAYNSVDGYLNKPMDGVIASRTNSISNPVLKMTEVRLYYSARMHIVEKAATDTDLYLGKYILTAVTEGRSYVNMKTRFNIPCSKDVYYDLYRKFFWLLSQARE